jgi:group I intron endonuclease
MKAICGIYKITSPSRKVYIGQSMDIKARWAKYKKFNCKSQVKLYRSLLKYGFHKHAFEIIQVCEPEKLNEIEKYYVDLFQTFNSKHGLNLKDGGGSKGQHSEETKLKCSISNRGRIFSDETRQKLSKALKGKKKSDEHARNLSKRRIGNKNCLGRVLSQETKDRIRTNNKLSKLVLNTQTGIYYDSAKEAAKSIGMKYGAFKNRLTGQAPTKPTSFIYA